MQIKISAATGRHEYSKQKQGGEENKVGHRKSSKKYCEIRKCRIYDNKGFTLVELLVGIAIVAIVGGLIGTFLIFSTRTYGKSN